MHSICQAEWKWFPVVRTTAKGFYNKFQTVLFSTIICLLSIFLSNHILIHLYLFIDFEYPCLVVFSFNLLCLSTPLLLILLLFNIVSIALISLLRPFCGTLPSRGWDVQCLSVSPCRKHCGSISTPLDWSCARTCEYASVFSLQAWMPHVYVLALSSDWLQMINFRVQAPPWPLGFE